MRLKFQYLFIAFFGVYVILTKICKDFVLLQSETTAWFFCPTWKTGLEFLSFWNKFYGVEKVQEKIGDVIE